MTRARSRNERGAIAVEAAIVVPLLVVLMFGVVEIALMMRDSVAVSSSVRTGSRIASASAGAGPGTCQASSNPPPCTPATVPAFAQAAADSIQRAGSAMPKDSISWVMIYEANVGGYPLPVGNTKLVCQTNCVTYVWDAALDRFRYQAGTWASTSVNACVNDPLQTSVGVAMLAQHKSVTGFIGSVSLSERSVMRFEPLPSEQCKANTHQ